ncbi:ankyrin [Ophiobolus disseminans]|uniref:Ankyrin n=1 Tax=Ophiobolus disseminans TaxID=1469910 RepID=A0A6A6ZYM3_9PLEO|nr:ankyrin [Ophiobolus disseminans]
MDPFSVTAGIAGLLSLSIQTHQIITNYIKSGRNAPTEAKILVEKLTALTSVLERFKYFLEEQKGTGNFTQSSVLCDTTTNCDENLRNLHTTLAKFISATRSDSTGLRRFVTWPLTSDKHHQTISMIHRYMEVFNMSLSIDGWNLLSKTAKEVQNLRSIQSGKLTSILDSLQNLTDSLYWYRPKVDFIHDTLMENQRLEMLEWISNTVDPSRNFNQALRNRHRGTGEWLLRSAHIREWISSPGLIWLHGIPGSGKTFLCSTVIEAVKAMCNQFPDRRLTYYYFDFQETEKQKTEPFIRSLLRQLVADEPTIPEFITKLFGTCRGRGQSPSLTELHAAFTRLLEGSRKDTYIILDALDEFPEWTTFAKRKEILGILKSLVDAQSPNVHILVTSRDIPEIREAFDLMKHRPVRLQSTDMDLDIASYVRSCLADPMDRRLSGLSDDLKAEIEISVGQSAHGMFLWAVCQLDMLRQCRKSRDIRGTLKRLPSSLDQTYERILSSIDDQYRPDAMAILQWLIASKRPLSLEELAEAAVVQPQDEEFDPESRLSDPSEALRICGGLITCSSNQPSQSTGSNSTIVRFAHYSVQEYLLSGRSEHFSISSHSYKDHVTRSCLQYLFYLKTLPDPRPEQCPLLRYVAQYWPEHVLAMPGPDPASSDEVYSLFGDDFAVHAFKWLRVYDPCLPEQGSRRLTDWPFTRYPGALYYAVQLNLSGLIKRLLVAGCAIDELHALETDFASANDFSHLLHRFLRYNYKRRTSFLQHTGTAISFIKLMIERQSALHLAVQNNNESLVELLLSHGADPNLRATDPILDLSRKVQFDDLAVTSLRFKTSQWREIGSSPGLGLAILNNNTNIVELLLKHGADPDVATEGIPSLIYAIRNKRRDIAALLLNSGADMNVRDLSAKSRWDSTAILAACLESDEDTTQLLINRGIDVNATNMRYTALQAGSRVGNQAIVKALIRAGANIDSVGQALDAGTPLFEAIMMRSSEQGLWEKLSHRRERHKDIIVMLLQHGAKIDASPHPNLPSPLSQVAEQEDHEVVELLLRLGSSTDLQSCTELTRCFCSAASNGYEDTVRLLLDAGVSINAYMNDPESATSKQSYALLAAASSGHRVVVEFLLGKNANVNPPTPRHHHAIAAAAAKGYTDIVQVLIQAGADINAPDCIQRAARYEHWSTVQLLVEAGVDVNAPAANRKSLPSLVYSAVSRDNIEMVRLLIAVGADAARPWYGRTPLRQAQRNSDKSIARLLQKHVTVYTLSTEAYTDIMNRIMAQRRTSKATGGNVAEHT